MHSNNTTSTHHQTINFLKEATNHHATLINVENLTKFYRVLLDPCSTSLRGLVKNVENKFIKYLNQQPSSRFNENEEKLFADQIKLLIESEFFNQIIEIANAVHNVIANHGDEIKLVIKEYSDLIDDLGSIKLQEKPPERSTIPTNIKTGFNSAKDQNTLRIEYKYNYSITNEKIQEKLDIERAEAFISAGHASFAQQKYFESVEFFEKAINIFNQNSKLEELYLETLYTARFNLGLISIAIGGQLFNKKQYKESAQFFQNAIKEFQSINYTISPSFREKFSARIRENIPILQNNLVRSMAFNAQEIFNSDLSDRYEKSLALFKNAMNIFKKIDLSVLEEVHKVQLPDIPFRDFINTRREYYKQLWEKLFPTERFPLSQEETHKPVTQPKNSSVTGF